MLVLAAIKGVHMELLELKGKVEDLQNAVERIEQTSTLELMSEDESDDTDGSEESEESEWEVRSVQSAP